MLLRVYIYTIILLLTGCPVAVVYGQIGSESELVSEAGKAFAEEDFNEAISLYSRLLSLHPEDPGYNFRFGVSYLHAKRDDASVPVKYLEKAKENGYQDELLHYHLGIAYHQDLKFAEATEEYSLFLGEAADTAKKREVMRRMEQANNGKSLLRENHLSGILEKKPSDLSNFHRSYPSAGLDGKILVKPEMFKSEPDRQNETTDLIFKADGDHPVFFASFGENADSGKDIYLIRITQNETWTDAERLPETINTEFDEDFPVLAGNGNILYFSSRGHNSMGGYDIFCTTYDSVSGSWSKPVNLDHEINTPFDDFLFIPVARDNSAWFASNRNTTGREVTVFHVKTTNPFPGCDDAAVDPAQASGDGIEEKSHGDLSAAENRDQLLKEKEGATQLADSAFYFVNLTEAKIRELKNQRDRAFRISGKKTTASAEAQNSSEQLYGEAASASGTATAREKEEEAETLGKKARQLKQRAFHAERTGHRIKEQISITETQLPQYKRMASTIQEKSATGTYDETLEEFSKLRNNIRQADTLTRYSVLLDSIERDITTYDLDAPAAEQAPPVVTKEAEPEVIDRIPPEKEKVVYIPAGPESDNETIAPEEVDEEFLQRFETMETKISEHLDEMGSVSASARNLASLERLDYDSLLRTAGSVMREADSAGLHNLIKETSLAARRSVISWMIHETMDSLINVKERIFVVKDEIRDNLGSGKPERAEQLLPELEKAMEGNMYMPDLVWETVRKLPSVPVTASSQAKAYAESAETFKAEYDQLMAEANELREKAAEKKPGKKADKLKNEAATIEKRAALKYDHYLGNRQRADELMERSETSKLNRQILDEQAALIRKKDEIIPVPSFANPEETAILADNLMDCGILTGYCEAYILAALEGEYDDTPPIEAVPGTLVLNQHGYNIKVGLIEKAARLLNTEQELLEYKADQQTEDARLNERMDFVNTLSGEVQVFYSEEKIKLDMAADNHPAAILNVPSRSFSESEWVEMIGAMVQDLSSPSLEPAINEYHDAVKIRSLNRFLSTYIKLEQMRSGIPVDDDIKLALSYLEEAEFLMDKATENDRKAAKAEDHTRRSYYLEDASVFRDAANEQLEIAFSVFKSKNPNAEMILSGLDSNIYMNRPIITPDLALKDKTERPLTEEGKTGPGGGNILFRVQLGAFSRELDDSHFGDIRPIFREKAGNNGVIRYLGGEFTDIDNAEKARDRYASKGYPNAFLVAYRNGEKISVEEATGLMASGENPPADRKEPATTTTEASKEAPPASATTSNEPERKETQPFRDLGEFTGSAYFVQIGAFSNPLSRDDVKGLGTVYTEKTAAGVHKYLLGDFTTEKEAIDAVKSASAKGYKGAFIVFHTGGERVLESDGEPSGTPERKVEDAGELKPHEEEIVFRVQIGAFSEKRPEKWISEMSGSTGVPVTQSLTGSGAYVCYAGDFSDPDEASELREQLRQNGLFPDAFVVAFYNGNKITVKQALELMNNNP